MERMKRMMTTTSAGLPIVLSMSSKSKLVGAAASCSRTAKVNIVATIRLLLKFQVTLDLRGSTRVFAETATRNGAPVPRPARHTVLLVERKNHVNGGVHFDGITIEKSQLIAPLPDSIQRGLLQQGTAVQKFEWLNRAVLTDDRVQSHGARDARLTSERRINRLNTGDDTRCLDVAAYTQRASQLRLRRGGGTPPPPAHTPPPPPPSPPPPPPPTPPPPPPPANH